MNEFPPKLVPPQTPVETTDRRSLEPSESRAAAGVLGNPFSTRHTRPGTMPYLFSSGETCAALVDRLESQAWWGEIVGPHGSGKSTLLAALVEALAASGRRPIVITLHDRQRSLPVDLEQRADLDATTLVVIDGCEQLGRWNRLRLKKLCRSRGWGLLVTSHQSLGLPRVCETAMTLELARRVVEQLRGDCQWRIDSDDIDRCYQRCDGNLREMLFELYDLYERTRTR